MANRYYELDDDVDFKGRWHLEGLFDGKGRELDARDFCNGVSVDTGPPVKVSLYDEDTIIDAIPPLRLSVQKKGVALDFTYSDVDMPVVTKRVADLLDSVARSDIQLIPVVIASRKEEYFIMNVASHFDCIDTKLSEIQWWPEDDEFRPELIGTPEMVEKLIIDGKRVRNSNIFRPDGWEVVVIVSELVKSTMEDNKVTGIRFLSVSP